MGNPFNNLIRTSVIIALCITQKLMVTPVLYAGTMFGDGSSIDSPTTKIEYSSQNPAQTSTNEPQQQPTQWKDLGQIHKNSGDTRTYYQYTGENQWKGTIAVMKKDGGYLARTPNSNHWTEVQQVNGIMAEVAAFNGNKRISLSGTETLTGNFTLQGKHFFANDLSLTLRNNANFTINDANVNFLNDANWTITGNGSFNLSNSILQSDSNKSSLTIGENIRGAFSNTTVNVNLNDTGSHIYYYNNTFNNPIITNGNSFRNSYNNTFNATVTASGNSFYNTHDNVFNKSLAASGNSFANSYKNIFNDIKASEHSFANTRFNTFNGPINAIGNSFKNAYHNEFKGLINANDSAFEKARLNTFRNDIYSAKNSFANANNNIFQSKVNSCDNSFESAKFNTFNDSVISSGNSFKNAYHNEFKGFVIANNSSFENAKSNTFYKDITARNNSFLNANTNIFKADVYARDNAFEAAKFNKFANNITALENSFKNAYNNKFDGLVNASGTSFQNANMNTFYKEVKTQDNAFNKAFKNTFADNVSAFNNSFKDANSNVFKAKIAASETAKSNLLDGKNLITEKQWVPKKSGLFPAIARHRRELGRPELIIGAQKRAGGFYTEKFLELSENHIENILEPETNNISSPSPSDRPAQETARAKSIETASPSPSDRSTQETVKPRSIEPASPSPSDKKPGAQQDETVRDRTFVPEGKTEDKVTLENGKVISVPSENKYYRDKDGNLWERGNWTAAPKTGALIRNQDMVPWNGSDGEKELTEAYKSGKIKQAEPEDTSNLTSVRPIPSIDTDGTIRGIPMAAGKRDEHGNILYTEGIFKPGDEHYEYILKAYNLGTPEMNNGKIPVPQTTMGKNGGSSGEFNLVRPTPITTP